MPVIAHTINEQICTARLEFDRVNTLKREREATEKRRQMEQISKGSTSTTVSSTIATDSTPKTGKEIKKK